MDQVFRSINTSYLFNRLPDDKIEQNQQTDACYKEQLFYGYLLNQWFAKSRTFNVVLFGCQCCNI